MREGHVGRRVEAVLVSRCELNNGVHVLFEGVQGVAQEVVGLVLFLLDNEPLVVRELALVQNTSV